MQIPGEVGGKKREQVMQSPTLRAWLVSSEVRQEVSKATAESSRRGGTEDEIREVRIRSGTGYRLLG